MLTFPISFSSPIVISVSILTVIGAYVLFGPEPKDRRRRGYPSGLINYGNNCFANAIVQCLSASSIFIQWIEKHLENNILAKILLNLIKSINGQSISYSEESTVATLIDHMRQPKWLSPFEQQDSHEFLLSLMNSLTSPQLIQSKQLGFAACLDSDEQEISKSIMIKESPLITPHPFQGLQATQLQCMECKHKNPISVSLFETLSLIIPERQVSNSGLFALRQQQRNFTLQELIGNYLKSEMITNLTCNKCKSKENLLHKKVTTFSRLPEILCLHIIRTTWTNEGWPIKNTCHVSFPDLLDMNAFISLSRLLPTNIPPTQTIKKPSTALYRLNSVLVHLGGISEAGHFIVYRRRVDRNEWLSISDDNITECSELQKLLAVLLSIINGLSVNGGSDCGTCTNILGHVEKLSVVYNENDSVIDHNCNSIIDMDSTTGKPWEEELCNETQPMGIAVLADTISAHFSYSGIRVGY